LNPYLEDAEKVPCIEHTYIDINRLNRKLDQVILKFAKPDMDSLYTSTGATYFSIVDELNPNNVLPLNDKSSHRNLRQKYDKIKEITQKETTEKEIIEIMHYLKIDTNMKGIKSPIEQFRIAQSAFKNPVQDNNPISASLIPMRESIKCTIDYLLKHRPLYLYKKRKKHISIT